MKQQIALTLSFLLALAFTSNAQEPIEKDTSKTSEIKTVETMPEFPGGNNALMLFVFKNRRYEKEEDKNNNGIVKVTFVIEKDGSVGDTVEVLEPISEYYDKEAIRIVKAMPKWTPGTQNGVPVRVQFTLPIKF